MYGFSKCSIKAFYFSIGGRPAECDNWKLDVMLNKESSNWHWFELGFIVSGDAFRVCEGGEDLKQGFDDGICCGGF